MDSYPPPSPSDRTSSAYGRIPWGRLAALLIVVAKRLYIGWVRRQRQAAARLFTALVGLGAVLYLLWRIRDVLPPFLIAFFLASLLDPVVTNLQRRGVSRGRAVASIYALVFMGIVLIILLIVPPFLAQIQDLAANSKQYSRTFTATADRWYDEYSALLQNLGMKQRPSEFLNDKSGPLADAAAKALDTVKGVIVGLAGQVLWLVIIPLALFYFLMDFQAIRAKLIHLLPLRHRANVDRMSQEIVEIFGAYTRGLAKVCALYGTCAVILFYLLGLNYALFLGLAAGVLYAVPYAGPALTLLGVIVVALTMGKTVAFTIFIALLLVAMQLSFDYGLTPRIVGGSVGLHPLVNIFALMCGATLFGIWGMLLAVPVAASLQMLLVYFFPRLAEKPLVAPVAPPAPDTASVASPEAETQPVADGARR